jgi:DedD protein
VIVVALAVILLPDLLDGQKVSNDDVFVSVPAAPNLKPIVDPEPFPSDRVTSAAQRPIEVVNEKPVDDNLPPTSGTVEEFQPKPSQGRVSNDDLASQTVVEAPKLSEEGTGWVIQLGSFKHQENVKQLLEKLENAGYRAFSRPIQTSAGPLTKVFVGPDLDKNKLTGALSHLQEVSGLKGKVTRFTVE